MIKIRISHSIYPKGEKPGQIRKGFYEWLEYLRIEGNAKGGRK